MMNDVLDIIPKPEDKSVVSSKWIYKIKHAANGSVPCYWHKFIFIINSLFLRESSRYKPFLVFLNTSINCMLYIVYPLGRYHTLSFGFGNYIPNIILHYWLVFFRHCFYPFFLLYSFFITGRFLIYKITYQIYITGKWLWIICYSCGAF